MGGRVEQIPFNKHFSFNDLKEQKKKRNNNERNP